MIIKITAHAYSIVIEPNNYLTAAFEHDAVVRARMVRKITIAYGRDSANDAARIRVVSAGACDPFSADFLDVDLAQNMVVPEAHCWHGRYRVKHVIDAYHTLGENGVHEIHKVRITNPGHTVREDSDVGI